MANSPQAKKRVRQNERRAATNRARVSRIRTFVKKVEEAIEASDQEAASAAFKAAEPELMRGAGKGVLHKRTAARKVSRLAGRIRSMAN